MSKDLKKHKQKCQRNTMLRIFIIRGTRVYIHICIWNMYMGFVVVGGILQHVYSGAAGGRGLKLAEG